MPDKAALGTRFTCFSCGTKFYDLNRPVATCPDCDRDQAEAPIRDMKSILQSEKGSRRVSAAKAEPVPVVQDDDDDDSDDDDDDDLLGDYDDDDSDGDDDDDDE